MYHAFKDKTAESVAIGKFAIVSRGKKRAFGCDFLKPLARLDRKCTHDGSFLGELLGGDLRLLNFVVLLLVCFIGWL